MKKSRALIKASVIIVSLISATSIYAGSVKLNLSADSTPTNPQVFYCDSGKGDDRILLRNHAQKIKGFNKNGTLTIKGSDLNKVYFQAYHDPNYRTDDPGYVQGNSVISSLDCNTGMGKPGENRTLVSGSFNLQ